METLDDSAEQERRDLQVVDGRLRVPELLLQALERLGIAEVPAQVRQPAGEALEGLLVERLTTVDDCTTRALLQVVDCPVVNRDADDRAIEQASFLEPVQRAQRHHLGQVARDAEGDEDVGWLRSHGPEPAREAPVQSSPATGEMDAGPAPSSTKPRCANVNSRAIEGITRTTAAPKMIRIAVRVELGAAPALIVRSCGNRYGNCATPQPQTIV